MGRIVLDVDIDASPERVWEIISDLEGAPERISGIDKIEITTEGPIGVGTEWRETRTMMGKEQTETMKIVAWEPGSHYTVYSYSCGSEFHWTMRVVPRRDGAKLETEMDYKAKTFLAKLMTPLGWLMSGFMKKCVMQDLQDAKTAAEGGTQPSEAEAAPA